MAKWRSVYSAVSSLACRRSWLMGRDWPPRTGKVVETLIHGWIVAGGDSSTMNSATCSSTRPSILLEARNSTPCPVSCCSDCCLRYLVIRGSWARYSLRFWLPLSLSTVAKAGRWAEIAGASPLNLKADSKTLAKWIWPLGTRLEPLACWGKRTWIYFVPCSSLLPAHVTRNKGGETIRSIRFAKKVDLLEILNLSLKKRNYFWILHKTFYLLHTRFRWNSNFDR